MTSPLPDELISAYLDGELNASERARVEEALRKDADLRRMCDELRALGSTLQSMPVADPSEDLAERVLRQAERRMLLGEVTPAEKTPAEKTQAYRASANTTRPVAAASAVRPWRRNWRLVAGVVSTVAALLLVAVVLFEQSTYSPANREVAMDIDNDMSGDVANRDGSTEEFATNGIANYSVAAGRSMPEDSQSAPATVMSVDKSMADAPLGGDLDRTMDAMSRGGQAAKETETVLPKPAADSARGFAQQPMQREKKKNVEHYYNTPRSGSKAGRSGQQDRLESGADSPARGAGFQGYGAQHNFGKQGADQPGISGVPPKGNDAGVTTNGVGGGLGGMPSGTTEPSTRSRKAESSTYKKKAMREQRSLRVTPPTSLGLSYSEDAYHTAKSHANIAQQLVRQLDREQSLLVQVSIPSDLQSRLKRLAGAEHDQANSLEEAVQELLKSDESSVVALRASSTRDQEQLERKLNRHLKNVVLVEGPPEAVRQSLERLIRRGDVRLLPMPLGAGKAVIAGTGNARQSAARSEMAEPTPPDAAASRSRPRRPDAKAPAGKEADTSATSSDRRQRNKTNAAGIGGEGQAMGQQITAGKSGEGLNRKAIPGDGFGLNSKTGDPTAGGAMGNTDNRPGLGGAMSRATPLSKGVSDDLSAEKAKQHANIRPIADNAKAEKEAIHLGNGGQSPALRQNQKPDKSQRGERVTGDKNEPSNKTRLSEGSIVPPPQTPSAATTVTRPQTVVHILFRFKTEPVVAPAGQPVDDP